LTGVQLTRLIDLQAEQNLATAEASGGAISYQGSFVVNSEVSMEFGDDIAAKWAQYQSELPGRIAVRDISPRMAEANVPLTQEQYRRLVKVYTAIHADGFNDDGSSINRQSPEEASVALETSLAQRELDDQRALTEASDFLSEGQLQIVRSASENIRNGMRSAIEHMRANAAAGQRERADPEC
jgi:hypothetical protein